MKCLFILSLFIIGLALTFPVHAGDPHLQAADVYTVKTKAKALVRYHINPEPDPGNIDGPLGGPVAVLCQAKMPENTCYTRRQNPQLQDPNTAIFAYAFIETDDGGVFARCEGISRSTEPLRDARRGVIPGIAGQPDQTEIETTVKVISVCVNQSDLF